MKIKKECLGWIIHRGKTKIVLSEVMDEYVMEIIKNEYPRYLAKEPEVKKEPKKTIKKKVEDVAPKK